MTNPGRKLRHAWFRTVRPSRRAFRFVLTPIAVAVAIGVVAALAGYADAPSTARVVSEIQSVETHPLPDGGAVTLNRKVTVTADRPLADGQAKGKE